MLARILCLCFRASLIYINNCPTRCNTKQSIYYSASSLYMFRVSTTPVIRSTQNCNYSLRYWSYSLCSYLPSTWPSLATLEGGTGGCSYSFVYSWWVCVCVCGWHPKHVEWTCRIINRPFCVASRWEIINRVARNLSQYHVITTGKYIRVSEIKRTSYEYLTVKKQQYYSWSIMLGPRGGRSLSASHCKVTSPKLGHFMWEFFVCKTLSVSYVCWSVHHLDSWIKRDQLDVTCSTISSARIRIPHHPSQTTT